MTTAEFIKQIWQLEIIRFPMPVIIRSDCAQLIGFTLMEAPMTIANDFCIDPWPVNPGMK